MSRDHFNKEFVIPIVLQGGSIVELRPIRPDDVERLQALFYRLSPTSVYLRFHHVLKQMSKETAKSFCNVDHRDTFALVAILGEGEISRIIAVGRYYRLAKKIPLSLPLLSMTRTKKKELRDTC